MKTRIIPIVFIALALAACGGSGDSQGSSAATALTKGAAPASTTTRPMRAVPTTTAPVTTKAPVASKAPTTTTAATTTLAPVAATGPNACTEQGPCKVGQTGPAGGIVFYVASAPQRWGQYLEVRPDAFEPLAYDTCNLEAYDSYAAGKIGDGITQIAAVIAACAKDGKPAAAGSYAKVNAYSQNGYRGWFIPTKDELQALLDSKVITFATDKDLTSGTWVNRPKDPANRSFEVVWGLKKEVLAGTAAYSRGGTVRTVEIMSDGPQSYGNPNNRWGLIYIARAFGPKA